MPTDQMAMLGKSQGHPSIMLFVQVDKYKYLVWVPGNCASVRLALQLASDAAVLKVISRASPPLSPQAYMSARGMYILVTRCCEGCSAGTLRHCGASCLVAALLHVSWISA